MTIAARARATDVDILPTSVARRAALAALVVALVALALALVAGSRARPTVEVVDRPIDLGIRLGPSGASPAPVGAARSAEGSAAVLAATHRAGRHPLQQDGA